MATQIRYHVWYFNDHTGRGAERHVMDIWISWPFMELKTLYVVGVGYIDMSEQPQSTCKSLLHPPPSPTQVLCQSSLRLLTSTDGHSNARFFSFFLVCMSVLQLLHGDQIHAVLWTQKATNHHVVHYQGSEYGFPSLSNPLPGLWCRGPLLMLKSSVHSPLDRFGFSVRFFNGGISILFTPSNTSHLLLLQIIATAFIQSD